jgi:uncharacterized glyoxalase superfamily protein PhnB
MATISTLTLETPDVAAAEVFYKALGVDHVVDLAAGDTPTSGFRGFTVSLVCAQPADVDAYLDAALAAGATTLKPATKSFWGYGGVVQAPDGAIWKAASSAKKNTAPATQAYQDLALLIGVTDVKATKQFYVDAGLVVAKAYGSKYVEFESAGSPVKLALYGRKALAKDAGVAVDGSGSHRLVIGGDLGTFTDPDGFDWA